MAKLYFLFGWDGQAKCVSNQKLQDYKLLSENYLLLNYATRKILMGVECKELKNSPRLNLIKMHPSAGSVTHTWNCAKLEEEFLPCPECI